jgi:hypothetical protein
MKTSAKKVKIHEKCVFHDFGGSFPKQLKRKEARKEASKEARMKVRG